MKKLFRVKEGGKLGGICTGLGMYFNLDSVIVRLLFVVLIPVGGVGIWLYLIMWLVVPIHSLEVEGAKSSARKLYLAETNKKVAGVCAGLGAVSSLLLAVTDRHMLFFIPALFTNPSSRYACICGVGVIQNLLKRQVKKEQ